MKLIIMTSNKMNHPYIMKPNDLTVLVLVWVGYSRMMGNELQERG